ncbi:MAG: aminotransferase class V-fold PLP-dependent enzyme [Chloroflexota bacterium]|jgi:L-cysteine/cystine lyase|tara:strand:- start:2202 stop:3371 length:1170 start_codon:yes stop_codon:yes gene_type:complete
MDIKKIRSLMPNINDMTYLNTGWSGPSPVYVVDAIKSRLELESFNGPTSPEILESAQKIMSDSKVLVSQLFNCQPEEVMLTDNTTDGINVILNGLPWKPGDEVVLCDLEHPSVLLPAYNLQSSKGVRLRMVSIGLDSNHNDIRQSFASVITGRTRLVMFSHIQYSTGLRMPVSAIASVAHKVGARVLVDGAQGPGHIELDMNALGVDFYSSPGQKWLLGPDQTGALFIRHNLIPELQPSRIGFGFSSNFNLEGRFEAVTNSIDKFSMSTTSAPLRAGYNAAVTKILSHKMPEIEKRNLELTKILKNSLSSVDGVKILSPLEGAECSALTTFQVDGVDSDKATLKLWKNDKIVVRAIESQQGIRVSTAFFNTEDEINKLVDAIKQLSKKR